MRKGIRGRRRLRRGLEHGIHVLPTFLTLLNLIMGFMAVMLGVYAVMQFADSRSAGDKKAEAYIFWAAWAVILGMVFDLLDGQAARWTKSTSLMGKELDSLADIVTFGVAPACLMGVLLYQKGFTPLYVVVSGGFYVACAALRLARYNVQDAKPSPTHQFTGLPSPAAAGALISMLILRHKYVIEEQSARPAWVNWFDLDSGLMMGLIAYMVGIGLLMVSQVPYAHLANRLFTMDSWPDAVSLYQALLAHNRTLETQIKIHQQMAFCHMHLGNLDEEVRAWSRIGELWAHQQDRLQALQDVLALMEKQTDSLPQEQLQDHRRHIEEQKGNIAVVQSTLMPELQLIVHMAKARERILAFRQQLNAPAAPPAAVANTGN